LIRLIGNCWFIISCSFSSTSQASTFPLSECSGRAFRCFWFWQVFLSNSLFCFTQYSKSRAWHRWFSDCPWIWSAGLHLSQFLYLAFHSEKYSEKYSKYLKWYFLLEAVSFRLLLLQSFLIFLLFLIWTDTVVIVDFMICFL